MLKYQDASYSWKFPVADVVYQFISHGYASLLKYELSGPTVHTVCLLIPRETLVSLNFLVSQPNTLPYYCHTNATELLDLPPPLPLITVNSQLFGWSYRCPSFSQRLLHRSSQYWMQSLQHLPVTTEENQYGIRNKVTFSQMLLLDTTNICILYMQNWIMKDCIHGRQKSSFKSKLLSSKINNCIVITGFTGATCCAILIFWWINQCLAVYWMNKPLGHVTVYN